jgi:hypothetical protein
VDQLVIVQSCILLGSDYQSVIQPLSLFTSAIVSGETQSPTHIISHSSKSESPIYVGFLVSGENQSLRSQIKREYLFQVLSIIIIITRDLKMNQE